MPQIRRSAPRLGEHSEQILADVGYPPDEIAGLIADRVVVSAPG
jgi:crotonobetainyl-CoA:carnitine CoA-transferase CaiB-like acyl-CoA transferase